jgi:hypothetical protein
VDVDDRQVFLDRTMDEIKAAPEFDPATHQTPRLTKTFGGYRRIA